MSCGKLLRELEDMVSEFPEPVNVETPMLGDSLQRMRESAGEPLLHLVPKARSIVKQFQRLARLLLTGNAEEPRGGDSALSEVN